MRIIRAAVENFKRIEVVEITPTGDQVEITGANAQGKSSVLDAIEWGLRGKRAEHAPPEPIRRGAERVRVVLDLGDLIVERVETKSSDRLVLRGKDGASYPKAQAKLDELVGGLAFDAMGFMLKKPAEQREVLLRVLGVDLAGFDDRRRESYDRRTQIGRDLAAARARLEAAPEAPEGTPDAEVSVEGLLAELNEAMNARAGNDRMWLVARHSAAAAFDAKVQFRRWQEKVEDLERQLLEARHQRDKAEAFAGDQQDSADKDEKRAGDLPEPEVEPIQARIAAAEATNRAVRQALARAELAAAVVRLARQQVVETARIEEIDAEKAAALAAAPMPVEGLAVTDEGVQYHGLPLEQASQSQQIRVCTAIGAALNPELRIALVRHGNDLDDASLAAFYEECRAHDLQAWVERIEGITEAAIVIEAGRIAE